MSLAPRLLAPRLLAPRLLALAVLSPLLALPVAAQAREVKVPGAAHGRKAAEAPRSRAVIAAHEGFSARMNRLDALMGGGTQIVRTRSASAEP